MNPKTKPQKTASRKKEDSLDSIYRYCRDMENVAGKFSALPPELSQEHTALVRKGWEKFDAERSMKKDISPGS